MIQMRVISPVLCMLLAVSSARHDTRCAYDNVRSRANDPKFKALILGVVPRSCT
jgi:hypothetical protein